MAKASVDYQSPGPEDRSDRPLSPHERIVLICIVVTLIGIATWLVLILSAAKDAAQAGAN